MKRTDSDRSDEENGAVSSPPSPANVKRPRRDDPAASTASLPWTAAAADLRARLEQVPLGFTEGQAVQDTTNWRVFRDAERVPRDDGYVVDRASGDLVPEPAFGDAFVTQMLNRERLLAEDGNYRLAELIAGFTNRPVDRLFTENSTRNRELYFRQAEAYMNSERTRRMTDAAAKQKQITDLENVVGKRIAVLRDTDALAADQLYYSQLAAELSSVIVLPQHLQRGLATPPRSMALLTLVVAQYRVAYRLAAFTSQLGPKKIPLQRNLCTRDELAAIADGRAIDTRQLLADVEQFFLTDRQYCPLVNTWCDAFLGSTVVACVGAVKQNMAVTPNGEPWRMLFEAVSFYLFMRDHAGATMTRLRQKADATQAPARTTPTNDMGPNVLGSLCIAVPRLALDIFNSMKQRRLATWGRLVKRRQTAVDGGDVTAIWEANGGTDAFAPVARAGASEIGAFTTSFSQANWTQVGDELFSKKAPWSRSVDTELTLFPVGYAASDVPDTTFDGLLKAEIPAIQQGNVVGVLKHWDVYTNSRLTARGFQAQHDRAEYVNVPALLAWLHIVADEFGDGITLRALDGPDMRDTVVKPIFSRLFIDTVQTQNVNVSVTWRCNDAAAEQTWTAFSNADGRVGRALLHYVVTYAANRNAAEDDNDASYWPFLLFNDAYVLDLSFSAGINDVLHAAPFADTVPATPWQNAVIGVPTEFIDALKVFDIRLPRPTDTVAVSLAYRFLEEVEKPVGYTRFQRACQAVILRYHTLDTVLKEIRSVINTRALSAEEQKRLVELDNSRAVLRHAGFQAAFRCINDQVTYHRESVSPKKKVTTWLLDNVTAPDAALSLVFSGVYAPRFSLRAAEAALAFSHRCLSEFWAFQLVSLCEANVLPLADADGTLDLLYRRVLDGQDALFFKAAPRAPPAPPPGNAPAAPPAQASSNALVTLFRGVISGARNWFRSPPTKPQELTFDSDDGLLPLLYMALANILNTSPAPLPASGGKGRESEFAKKQKEARKLRFLWPKRLLARVDPVLQLGELAYAYGETIGQKAHADLVDQIERLRETIDRAHAQMLDIVGDDTPGANGLSAQQRFLRGMYVEPPEHALRAALTGTIVLRPNVVAAMEQALATVHAHVPSLAGITLDEVTRAPVASGLPGAFARLAAAFINQAELANPNQYNTMMQHRLNVTLRHAAVAGLQDFVFDRATRTVMRRDPGGSASGLWRGPGAAAGTTAGPWTLDAPVVPRPNPYPPLPPAPPAPGAPAAAPRAPVVGRWRI
jgi:hypothetical protein